jgi:hypothetical protein
MSTWKKTKAKNPPKSIRRIHKKIGDVIEIQTSKGLAYVQYTHEHKGPGTIWGSLIRVLEGFYKTRPSNKELAEIVNKPHRFQTFCPVHRMVNIGDWERVGNFPVPEFAQKFPIFKNCHHTPEIKPEDKNWSLWDGEKSWRVGKLSLEEQMKYPKILFYPGVSLIHAIETGMSRDIKLC